MLNANNGYNLNLAKQVLTDSCETFRLIKAPLYSLREEDYDGISATWPHGDAGQRAVPGLYDVWR
jgi:hypothetical protein